MAASMAVAANTASVVALQKQSARLSSSSAFGAPLVSAAPLRPAAKQHLAVARAALPEEASSRIARREILASLVAVGAAFTTVANVKAAQGPGVSGAERTAQKADDLLKEADKFKNDESPPRFGSGEAGSAGQDVTDLTQKAGSGAVTEIQGAENTAVEKAPEGVDILRQNFQQLFDSGNADIPPALQEGAGQVKGKVKSDVSTAKGAASDAGSALPDTGSAGDKAKSFVADAQKSGGNIVDDLTAKAKEILPK